MKVNECFQAFRIAVGDENVGMMLSLIDFRDEFVCEGQCFLAVADVRTSL